MLRKRVPCARKLTCPLVQSTGLLKVFPAGFQWRKNGGGKDVSVPKDGALALHGAVFGLVSHKRARRQLLAAARACRPGVDAHPGQLPAVAREEGASLPSCCVR